ncbi:MAG TPA: hypothetical protein VGQ59_09115 [Cyclobacteriaceae bacterium]|nr:hypothetical protein [Cyclobacteriaceae bacterium]
MKKIFLASLALLLSCFAWAQDKSSTSSRIVDKDHGYIIVHNSERHHTYRLMEMAARNRQMAANLRLLRTNRINRLATKWSMKVRKKFHRVYF